VKFNIRTKLILSSMLVITIMALMIITVHIVTNASITKARMTAERYQEAENLGAKLFVEMSFGESALQNFLTENNSRSLAAFTHSQRLSRQYTNRLKILLAGEPKISAPINHSIAPFLNYLDDIANKAKKGAN
jgi:CHASE3 domain sensor protein